MRRSPRSALARLLLPLVLLVVSLSPLRAQGARDSLIAGRHAYERAQLEVAIRLLEIGLASGGTARDTLWVGGAHMLTDALLERGRDTLALLWAKWIQRAVPGLPIDSATYPPRVALNFLRARATLGPSGAADTSIATVLEPVGDTTGRGVLRLMRASVGVVVVVESVGTMLPGESRAMPAGTYTLRVSADGFPTLRVAREVLPGFATIVTTRFSRPAGAGPAAAGAAGARAAGAAGGAGDRPATTPPPPTGRAAAVSPALLAAAGGTTCTILDGGAATCWGENRAGQLGGGLADSSPSPIRVSGGQPFQAISVAATHACAITVGGQAYCWGSGASGELGNGRALASAVPVAVTGAPTFIAIGVGATHSCALTQSGAVYCWGSNRNGELGNRAGDQSASPVAVTPPAGVSFTSLAVGGSHACALGSNASLYCWGDNSSGQIGNGSTNDAEIPVAVQSSIPLKSVALGTTHSCGLTAAGAAWCWGSNTSGQLGLGAQGPLQSQRPAPVEDSLTFAALAAGDAHTCGLTQGGAAYCWGSGRSGQLGNAGQADSPRPVLVVGGQSFRSLSLGASHSCGLAADGVVWCWGDNGAGQLGALAGRSSMVPVPVFARPPWRLVVAATAGSLARSVTETFDDGNWTVAPAWSPDSASGVVMVVAERTFEMTRGRGRLAASGAGLSMPVRIPVTRTTQLRFDVMVLPDTLHPGCGLNCATWPAAVRLRVRNTNLTESEVWYVYGDHGGTGRRLGNVVIVAKGDVPPGRWLRGERFTVRDSLPRADTIIQIAVGSVGADVGARFDNISVPVQIPRTMVLTPDNAQLPRAGARAQLRSAVFDSAGTATPWVGVTWSSSDTLVARVDSTGLVTAVAGGRAIIRAAAGAITDSASVTVTAATRRRRR